MLLLATQRAVQLYRPSEDIKTNVLYVHMLLTLLMRLGYIDTVYIIFFLFIHIHNTADCYRIIRSCLQSELFSFGLSNDVDLAVIYNMPFSDLQRHDCNVNKLPINLHILCQLFYCVTF